MLRKKTIGDSLVKLLKRRQLSLIEKLTSEKVLNGKSQCHLGLMKSLRYLCGSFMVLRI